jgi:polyisoprenoid-binding protein YceI
LVITEEEPIMKRFISSLALAALLAAPGFARAEPMSWNIDPVHSSVTFKIRHLVSRVQGEFKEFSGTITYDPADAAAGSVEVVIAAASIDTKNDNRDKDLRSAKFFDVETYPDITFKSTKVEKTEDGDLKVSGDLTMHGITRPVVLDAEFLGSGPHPRGGQVAGFSATTTLNRKDFGITWNRVLDAGGTLLGDDVQVEINLEAVHAEDKIE